ncbi:TNF receptor-associated factor 5-like isoform X2 [Hydra vulgaris]|uniref:TNF receptor-associated factor 5-like isoform X2 n=1 Tax=Hydra vulgaris TaxID=6087 RepID=A0ABM4DK16_HYDVU
MKCSDAEKIGGYNAHFLQELLDEYECPVCQMVLREPILTVCGHRLCLSCSEEMRKRNNGVLVCPLDNTILKPGQTFPDKAIERAILQLKVKCNNFLKKCQWTGELKAINNHLGSCEYQEVKCPNGQCSTSLLRKELTDHIKINCIYRFINCQHCNQKILFCEKQNHMETCRCLPLYCVNQCGMVILRKEMSSHITDSCASTIVPCQYFYIGCNFKGMRKEQDTHVNSSIQNHLSLAISKVVANEREITILKNEMEMKKEQDQFLVTSKMVELEKKILVIEKEMKIKNTKPNNEQEHHGKPPTSLAKWQIRSLTLARCPNCQIRSLTSTLLTKCQIRSLIPTPFSIWQLRFNMATTNLLAKWQLVSLTPTQLAKYPPSNIRLRHFLP